MSYMVIFQSPDGNAGYNQFEQLEGAVEFVETLRNEQGVENARMFDLKEIEFVMTPTWHVDMAALGTGSPAQESPADVAPPTFEEPVVDEPVVEEQPAAPVDLTDTPPPSFEAPAMEPLQEYAPPTAPDVPVAESFPPPPAPPADGGPSFLPPPPMPPNEDLAPPPAPDAPVAPEAEQPARRGLFGR